MPEIEYQDVKLIKRKFTSVWNENWDKKEFQRLIIGLIKDSHAHINTKEQFENKIIALISSQNSMTEYIELLHDEIDKLNNK